MQTSGSSSTSSFFDAHQRATVAAAMARIIPTDDAPGAAEAGTIDFLDRYLSGISYIFAKPDGSGFEVLEGKQAAVWTERITALREKYIAGIADLDRISQSRFDAPFAQLTPEDQDRVLAELERPSVRQEAAAAAEASVAYSEPGLQQTVAEADLDFFPLLVLHTRQGFYSDPIYGGNRDHVGWKAIDFPGPASLAETHAGRYSTLPFFAPGAVDAEKEAAGAGEAEA
jgi:gluconate 2-dehydrogenase gamma chain